MRWSDSLNRTADLHWHTFAYIGTTDVRRSICSMLDDPRLKKNNFPIKWPIEKIDQKSWSKTKNK